MYHPAGIVPGIVHHTTRELCVTIDQWYQYLSTISTDWKLFHCVSINSVHVLYTFEGKGTMAIS